jgi:hypothetical protein
VLPRAQPPSGPYLRKKNTRKNKKTQNTKQKQTQERKNTLQQETKTQNHFATKTNQTTHCKKQKDKQNPFKMNEG